MRLFAISAIEWVWWGRIVLGLILVNSLMLTMTDPYDEPPESVLGVLLFNVGNVFTVIFALEALVRMVAMGVWGHPHAYCQDSWNNLDLVIVVAGLLEISGASSAKFSMLRTLRILRPLRSITRIPSLRLLITTIVQSWRPLAHAAAVTIVLTASLAIVGVAAFQGKLRQRCFVLDTGLRSLVSTRPCDLGVNGPTFALQGAFRCRFDEACLPLGLALPGEPVGHFDNVLAASLSVFRVMLLDGWHELMAGCIDTGSWSSLVYFLVVVMGGPCFATNLFLAVITQRLKLLSDVDTIAILNLSCRRWSKPLLSRAYTKWKKHWEAGQEALESTILAKLDTAKLPEYNVVLQRMGFRSGALVSNAHSRALNCWKHWHEAAKVRLMLNSTRVHTTSVHPHDPSCIINGIAFPAT
jgi:hypothetical protein